MQVFVGTRLFENTGKWERAPSSFAFQWERSKPKEGKQSFGAWTSFEPIAEATEQKYIVQLVDEGCTLRCAVKPTNENGTSVDYGPIIIVQNGRTEKQYVYGYGPGSTVGPRGAEPGKECTVGCFPGSSPNSNIIIWLHEGAFTEQPARNEQSPGEPVNEATEEEPISEEHPAYVLRNKAKSFQEKGYACFVVNWRQGSNAVKPSYRFEIQDIERVVKWVQANAEFFNGNPAKIGIIGGSGGASLAGMVASKLNKTKPNYVKVAVMVSGISSVAERALDALAEIQRMEENPYATLTSQLNSGTEYNELKVAGLTKALPENTNVFTLTGGQIGATGITEKWKVTTKAEPGDTVIHVEKHKCNSTYPIGSKAIEDPTEETHHINHMEYLSGITLLDIPGWLARNRTGPSAGGLLDEISTIGNLTSGMPPFLYFISKNDKTPLEQAATLKTALKNHKNTGGEPEDLSYKLTFYEVENGHAFAYWAAEVPGTGKSVSEVTDEFCKAALA